MLENMPIKFKCNCGQVISVPEKMAGKSGKCPKCKNGIKVPVPKQAAGKQPAAAQPKAAGKQQAAKKPAGKKSSPAAAPVAVGGALDSLFEEAGLTQQVGPTCSNCAAPIQPGTVICTSCGFNLESGESIKGYDVQASGPEFGNEHLQLAADNMKRDLVMQDRRDKAQMPWWVVMSFLIGAVTLCAAGVVIVDGQFGTPDPETTLIGKVQRWPVFITLGLTAGITGVAIIVFAHMSICFYGFTQNVWQGVACFCLPLLYSVIYGIMNWHNNKAPVKAIMLALAFVGFGSFLIVRGGGFPLVIDAFK